MPTIHNIDPFLIEMHKEFDKIVENSSKKIVIHLVSELYAEHHLANLNLLSKKIVENWPKCFFRRSSLYPGLIVFTNKNDNIYEIAAKIRTFDNVLSAEIV